MSIELGPGGKPLYRDKHACDSCGCGYIDCASYANSGLKCCKSCSHPTRWSTVPPYTDEEIADMQSRFGGGWRRTTVSRDATEQDLQAKADRAVLAGAEHWYDTTDSGMLARAVRARRRAYGRDVESATSPRKAGRRHALVVYRKDQPQETRP